MSNLEIKPYLVRCVYHIEEREDYRILASSKEQAGAIGRIKFKEGHTSKCHLNEVVVIEDGEAA